MEVEVKVLLKEEKDYASVMQALQALYLKDDWHQDFFFDFTDGLLEKTGSVLRLRITSPPSFAHNRAQTSAGGFNGGAYLAGGSGVGPAWGNGGGGGGASYGLTDSWSSGPYNSLKGLGGGRLMLKEHSVVDEGSHIAFKEEDTKVSPAFVRELLTAPDIMVVLRKMAQQDPKRKAAKILENLERIAGREIDERVQKKVNEQDEQQDRLTQEIMSQGTPLKASRDGALSVWNDEGNVCHAGTKRPRDNGVAAAADATIATAASVPPSEGVNGSAFPVDAMRYEDEEEFNAEEEEDILIPVASSHDVNWNTKATPSVADADAEEEEERFVGSAQLPLPVINMTPEKIRDEVSAELLQLKHVGNYVTHRQIYSYFDHQITRPSTSASQLSPEARRQQSRHASQSKGSQHTSGAAGRGASSTPTVPWTSQQLTDEEQLLREKMQIRLDLVEYPFGIRYEIEIPDVKLLVDEVSDEVVSFLKGIGAEYELGKESKFSRFRNGVKALHVKNVAVKEVKLRLPHSAGYDELFKALERNLIYYLDPSGSKSSKSHRHRRGSADSAFCTPPTVGLSSAENPYIYACNAPPTDTSAERLVFQHVKAVLQHNYFFDSSNGILRQHGCLLRLRCFDGDKNSFELVLKEKQVITRGSQHSNNRTIRLAPDVAIRLLKNPRKFIVEERECNEIAQVLESELGVTELDPIASFATWRTTFKWNTPPFLTHGDGDSGVNRAMPESGALMIRLDKTTYPQLSKDTAIPGSTAAATQSQTARASGARSLKRTRLEGGSAASRFESDDGESLIKGTDTEDVIDEETMGRLEQRVSATCNEEALTCYEVEVTNLGAVPPALVKEQITLIFRALNVEWDECSQNKLEFYMSLYENTLARTSGRTGAGVASAPFSFQWQQSGTAAGGSLASNRPQYIPPAADWQL